MTRDPYRKPGAKLVPVAPRPVEPVFPAGFHCTMCLTESLQWIEARDGTRRLFCSECDQVIASNAPLSEDE